MSQLLLSKCHGPAGDHDALVAAVLELGHLLNDRSQTSKGQTVAIRRRDNRATKLKFEDKIKIITAGVSKNLKAQNTSKYDWFFSLYSADLSSDLQ